MPNPPPPPPPLPPNPPPPSTLRKFSPVQAPPPNAPILAVTNGTGPISPHELAQMRTSLVLSRMLAAERLAVRDQNRALLDERQAAEQRAADEQARVRDGERRRRREEDERKERERVEKAERERVEKEKEERRRAKQAEKEEEARRAKSAAAQKPLEKQKAMDVLSIVQTNQAPRRPGTDGDGDTVMGAATPSALASTPSSALPTPPPPVPKSKASRTIASSPEVDDEVVQPKPPRHHDKKKRKRDHVVESDASDSEVGDQPLIQKLRKLESHGSGSSLASPSLPVPGPSHPKPSLHPDFGAIERRLKEERYQKHSIPIKPPPPGGASAFFVPQHPLVPPKPPVVPPVPTAKRQADVSGDFSVAKPGQQIAHSTFQNWVDAYLRPFGEDDLAFLAAKPEDVSPYIIPPLGKHYLDKWEEEDAETPGGAPYHPHPSSHISPLVPPVLPRLRPDALTEDALATENVFLGPLSERLIAAMAFEEGGSGLYGEEDEGGQEGEDGPVPPRLPLDAVDLEERIKKELRFIGLLPEEDPDWSSREDDEISSSLRACQRLLHQQSELNEARKATLMAIVKDRMAYQDYETARDAQERVIEQGWTKRTRQDTKKAKKKKDRDRARAPADGAAAGAAGGGGAGADPSKQPISLDLVEAVEKRNRLVQAFQSFFEEEEQGRYYGLPERSVYEGLEVGDEEFEDEGDFPLAGPSQPTTMPQ
ncbi:hypothetical protein JCM8547_002914 [Rhodosporidiobolus lusitaniae]